MKDQADDLDEATDTVMLDISDLGESVSKVIQQSPWRTQWCLSVLVYPFVGSDHELLLHTVNTPP